MKLSIVIVNYNVKHFLEQCLKSVANAVQGIDAETYVVDNNSVDGSVDMVKRLFPDIHLIANTDNVGFSSANNQAIELSKGEYVLLLNPDTVVPENCFKKLIEFMDSTPDAGACGIHMVDGQGKFLPESKRGLPTPEVALYKMIGLNKIFPKSKKFGKYHLGYLPEDQTNEVEILSGAFMFMRKKALDEVGLLDETFFMYGEDIDLSYRIIKGGWKNYYYADSSIIHYKGESTKKLSTNYVRVFYKAMAIFAEKHYTGGSKKAFTFLLNAAIFLRASLTVFANFFRKFWMPMVELIVMFGSLYILTGYWEEHIKYNDPYPLLMFTFHLPFYAFTWITSLWFIGSYKNPFDFSKLLRGIVLGTVIISMIYGLLPNEIRYSRGIILFGTLVVTTVILLWRTAFHFAKYKSLDLNQHTQTKSLLVGSKSKWNNVSKMLQSHANKYEQIGFVTDEKVDDAFWLGSVNQLKEIVKIYGVNEVIFSAETISARDTMKWMNSIGPNVSYYTIPANSDFVIGSHSKNANGLYIGEQIELNLSKSEFKTQKRMFDIATSLAVLVLSPILLLTPKRKLIKPLFPVLFGMKTWVGYSGDLTEDLPGIKSGIIQTDYMLKMSDSSFQNRLDKLYAKNYSIWIDLRVIFQA